MTGSDYARISAWALDFVRAVRANWLARLLFRVVIGKYAYAEFIGLQDALHREGFFPYFDYDLEGMDYHKETMPDKWWEEREYKPLKSSRDEK